MEMDDDEGQGSCVVSGALAFVLRLNVCMGLTPATLKSCSRGSVLRIAPARYVGGCVVYGLLFLSTITFVIWSNAADVVPRDTTGVLFSLATCATVMMITAAVFKGMKRTRELVVIINSIQKLNLINKQQLKVDKIECRRKYLTVIYLTVYVLNFVLNMLRRMPEYKMNYNVAILSNLYKFFYTVLILQSMQFMFIVLVVHSSFQSVTLALGEIYLDVKRGCAPDKWQAMPYQLRRLGTAYSFLCDLVRELNVTYGASILASLCLTVYSLGWTGLLLVYIISAAVEKNDASLDKVLEITANVVSSVIYFTNIILLIEPCHRTHHEMHITKNYVNQTLYHAPKHGGPVVNELEMFRRVIILESASYSPLKLCTMERLLAIEMISAIISYVVIVLQIDT